MPALWRKVCDMRIYLASLLAGMRQNDLQKLIEAGKPKYLLNTFYEGEDACKKVLNIVGSDNFLLDSGAFSFMSGAKCNQDSLEKYCDNYIDFIKRHKISQYFEMDVDTIFGLPYVEYLRRRIEKETNVPCIPVWHKGRGIEYWKQMCKKYDYVAIGGLVFHVKQQEWPLIKKMVDYAYDRGVKVHGLGFTKTKLLHEWKWYSVDSSSWKMSAIRGNNKQFFNGRYIDQKQIKSDKFKIDQRLLAMYNGIEWCKYQRYMDLERW